MTNDQGLFYIDTNSVTQEDGRKTVQSVLDYKKPQTTSNGRTYMSLQSQVQVGLQHLLQLGPKALAPANEGPAGVSVALSRPQHRHTAHQHGGQNGQLLPLWFG
jgi:hypothetical protein